MPSGTFLHMSPQNFDPKRPEFLSREKPQFRQPERRPQREAKLRQAVPHPVDTRSEAQRQRDFLRQSAYEREKLRQRDEEFTGKVIFVTYVLIALLVLVALFS